MRIEDISSESVKSLSEKKLKEIRFRISQIWRKHFQFNKKNSVVSSHGNSIGRGELLDNYRVLKKELADRNIDCRETSLDRIHFKRAMYGIEPRSVGQMVIVDNYVSIGGSYVKSPKSAKDVDVIIRDSEENRDEGLELKLGRTIKKETGKNPHFVYAQRGPHSSYVPLFDLVLRPKDKAKRVSVEEGEKRDREYYEGLESWDKDLKTDNNKVMDSLSEGSVLDLGCGSGKLLKILQDQGRKVQGVEVNKTALDMARKKGVPMREHDLRKGIPFGNGTFDNVIAVHVIEHMDEPQSLLKEMARVSKNKAIALVPLGERLDPSHKQKYESIGDFKKEVDKKWRVVPVKTSNAVIAILSKETKKAKELTPFGKFDPPKPAMSGMTEAFDVSQIWDWAKSRKLVAEPKLNGFRMVIAKEGDDYRIYTDSMENRAKYYPSLKEEIKKIPDDFIVDCSMGIERDEKPLPRIKLMTLMADKPELKENDVIVCTVFDIPFWKEDFHTQGFEERRKKLESFYNKYLKGSDNFDITECEKISGKEDLERTFKKFGKYPQSEGVVVKDVESKWDTDGNAEGWAKLKIEAEIKVMVIKKHDVKGGNYNYTCGVLKGGSEFENVTKVGDMELINLGKTYNTEISASPGDILTIGVEEIIPQEKDLSWLGPRVLDIDKSRKEPYYANQVIKIAENANILQKQKKKAENEEGAASIEGNIDFEKGDKGEGVAQLHIMGIEKDELEDLKGIQDRAKVARSDLKKLEDLLKNEIGEQGAHIDLRFHRKGDKYWEGGEIMTGNLSGLDKIYDYKRGNYLRYGWKVPRKGEAKINIIKGPMSWFKAGVDKLEVFKPGEVGATENMYGAMLRIDKFNWELYKADEHAKKFHITDSKFFDGNWLISYVPVTEEGKKGKRVWMMSKLDKDDHKKKQEEEETEKLDLEQFRSEGIDEDLKNPKKHWRELVADLRYLGNSGFPKLKAGREWGEWRMEDILRYYATTVDKLRSVYFPVIPPKMGEESYKTSYWEAYRKAKKYMKSKPPSKEEAKEWDKKRKKILKAKSPYFSLYKVGKEEEKIAGGIVYTAGEEDTQGDTTTSEELWEALKKYMIKKGVVKIMHKGQKKNVPIVECYFSESDHIKGGQTVPKHTWWMTVYLGNEPEIWKLVKEGKLTGFSLGGTAREEKT